MLFIGLILVEGNSPCCVRQSHCPTKTCMPSFNTDPLRPLSFLSQGNVDDADDVPPPKRLILRVSQCAPSHIGWGGWRGRRVR